MKFEKEHVINEEWVLYYSNDGKIPLASIKSFIQLLFIMMLYLAYASYTHLSTLETVEIMKEYAESYSHCNFNAMTGSVSVDCGNSTTFNPFNKNK